MPPRQLTALRCGLSLLIALMSGYGCSDESGGPQAMVADGGGPASPILSEGDAGLDAGISGDGADVLVPDGGLADATSEEGDGGEDVDDAGPDMEVDMGPDDEADAHGGCAPEELPLPRVDPVVVECESAQGTRISLDICDLVPGVVAVEWMGPVPLEPRCDPVGVFSQGPHAITAQFTDAEGRVGTLAMAVLVQDTTPPVPIISGDPFPRAEGCAQGTVALRDDGPGDRCSIELTRRWRVDGEPAGEGATLNASLPVGAPHLVELELCDGNGRCAVSSRYVAPSLIGHYVPRGEALISQRPFPRFGQHTGLDVELIPPEGCPLPAEDRLGALVRIGDVDHVVPAGRFRAGEYRAPRHPTRGIPLEGALGALPSMSEMPDGLRLNGVEIDLDAAPSDGLTPEAPTRSAIALAMAINEASALTSVYAWPLPATLVSEIPRGGNLDATNWISINGHILNGFTVRADDADGALKARINQLTPMTGVEAVRTRYPPVSRSLDGRNIEIEGVGNGLLFSGFDSYQVATGGVQLWSERPIVADWGDPQLFDVGEWSGATAAVSEPIFFPALDLEEPPPPGFDPPDDFGTRYFTSNGVPFSLPPGPDRFAAEIAAAFEEVADASGVHAHATAARLDGVTPISAGAVEGLSINGVLLPPLQLADGDADGALRAAINGLTAVTGVEASIDAGALHLTAPAGGRLEVTGPLEALGIDLQQRGVMYGRVVFSSDSTFEIGGVQLIQTRGHRPRVDGPHPLTDQSAWRLTLDGRFDRYTPLDLPAPAPAPIIHIGGVLYTPQP